MDKVRQAIASDRRIGPAFLFPGVGYGGSCFPKDVKAIIKFSADKKYRFRILEAVEAVNERAEDAARRQGRQRTSASRCKGKTIAVWGLAFKPRTDDMREAPAVPIIEGLLERGREGAGVRSRGAKRREAHLRRRSHLRDSAAYDALEGRRRAADRDRVERVPRARLRADEEADEDAGRSSTAATSTIPRRFGALGFTYYVDRPAMSTVLVPGAPATSAATPSRRCAAAGYDVVVYDNLSAGPRRGGRAAGGGRSRPARSRSSRRRPRRRGARARDRRRVDAVMHFAARLLGRRVGARAARLLRDQRRRHAGRARRDGRGRRARSSSSRPPARRSASRGDDADRRRRIRSGRSTPTARPSSRSSARCRTSSAPRHALGRAALLQRRRRRSGRADRRGPRSGGAPDSARHRRRARRRSR